MSGAEGGGGEIPREGRRTPHGLVASNGFGLDCASPLSQQSHITTHHSHITTHPSHIIRGCVTHYSHISYMCEASVETGEGSLMCYTSLTYQLECVSDV